MPDLSEKRDIPGYPDYKIDRRGNVWSYKDDRPRKLKQFMDRSGTMRINLFVDGKYNTLYPQRLVCQAFHTTAFDHKNISVRRHRFRSKKINYADRFFWGTQSEVKRKNQTAWKLTEEQRKRLLVMLQSGFSQHEIAEELGISQPAVSYHKRKYLK